MAGIAGKTSRIVPEMEARCPSDVAGAEPRGPYEVPLLDLPALTPVVDRQRHAGRDPVPVTLDRVEQSTQLVLSPAQQRSYSGEVSGSASTSLGFPSATQLHVAK